MKLHFIHFRNVSILSLLLLSTSLVSAQISTIVTGTVTEFADRLPIPGVTIIVKGTTVGTITDLDGKYTLSVPEDGTTLFILL